MLIEGLDLAGKSTLCNALHNQFQDFSITRRNSLIPNNELYKQADIIRLKGLLHSSELANLYLSALNTDIIRYTKPDTFLIQDSTIALRSYSHYAARGHKSIAEKFHNLLEEHHPNFDRTIVLMATIDKRLERLEMRRELSPHEIADDDLLIERDPTTFLRMENILVDAAKKRFNAVVVDTRELSSEDVFSAAVSIITD